MKNKGFTLVELMGTMVILAIVITIAISGFGNVRKNVQKKEQENLVKYIETKAEEYASNTGKLVTNVDQLVKEGYLEADDEKGNVISPEDGSILNCHIVNIEKAENNLYGKYTEEEECNLEELEITNLNFGVRMYKTKDGTTKEGEIGSNEWVGENVLLEGYIKEGIQEEEIKEIRYKSNVGEEKREINKNFEEKNKYVVKAEQIVNTTYTVSIELKSGEKYQTQVRVKIDKQRPVIYGEEIEIEKEEEYSNQGKKIKVRASDGNGSGIYGYYIGERRDCRNVEYQENSKNEYEEEKEEGVYYVCVKDKVGNVSEEESSKRIEVKKIDKTLPECELEAIGILGKNGYYISDIEIRMKKAIDKESGVNHTLINYPKITNDTNGMEVTGTVVDNAGNSNTCKIVVKKDSYRPTISKKQEEIYLGTGEYDFRWNVETSLGISGGQVICNPPSSLKTGKYTVTCSVIGNNGLQSSVSFYVAHSYSPTMVPYICENMKCLRSTTCKKTSDCWEEEGSYRNGIICRYICDDGSEDDGISYDCESGDGHCGTGNPKEKCLEYQFCLKPTCPNGGNYNKITNLCEY